MTSSDQTIQISAAREDMKKRILLLVRDRAAEAWRKHTEAVAAGDTTKADAWKLCGEELDFTANQIQKIPIDAPAWP